MTTNFFCQEQNVGFGKLTFHLPDGSDILRREEECERPGGEWKDKKRRPLKSETDASHQPTL
jgi:hypothetical protein